MNIIDFVFVDFPYLQGVLPCHCRKSSIYCLIKFRMNRLQSDPCVELCFAGGSKTCIVCSLANRVNVVCLNLLHIQLYIILCLNLLGLLCVAGSLSIVPMYFSGWTMKKDTLPFGR